MSKECSYKVGSRKSELALIQTNMVIDDLKKLYPDKSFEIVTMTTMGDQILDRPLPKIGEKSLFTKELEVALANNSVDLVVHSLKDMPTSLPPGLAIGAVLKREDPRDAVILHPKHRGRQLNTLPTNSFIGTSSLRRAAQLRRNYPQLTIKDIRGNLQTRLSKLDKGEFDGIILAVAGVLRMGWEHRISQILECNEMLYAVGQGALAVECRVNDCAIFAPLNHQLTALSTIAERSLLNKLGGGCSAPVAVSSKHLDNSIELTAAVWSLDGSVTLQQSLKKEISNIVKKGLCQNLYCGMTEEGLDKAHVQLAYTLGIDLATALIDQGALTIIEEAKIANSKDT